MSDLASGGEGCGTPERLQRPYYEDAAVTIYHGDCLSVLPQLEAIDHVLTDPPFEAEAHTKARRVMRGERNGSSGQIPWTGRGGEMRVETLPFDAITEAMRESAAAEIARLCKRWALVFTQAESAHKWEAALLVGGLARRRWCVWIKPDGQPQFSGDRPGMGYETIVACHAQGRSKWNGGGKLGVFRHVKNITGSQQAQTHPTEKPIALMRELVSLFTDPGDIILDPFMGSGTTLRAAKDLGRKAIGIEIEERYCEIAAKRMSQSVMELSG